ncbi:uncharacterized protein [Leptinotarsa decemlineata]|uniref:uncharacterized protein n=1 Tax=Leptinotarsa decemlineata TaxID=7539 RepID=UPI003D30B71A
MFWLRFVEFLFYNCNYFTGSDAELKNVNSYCTVADIVTIKSMKTGEYVTAGNSGDTLEMNPEEKAEQRFWKLLAGNGFYIFQNVNTSNIIDIMGGCYEGMQQENVISYNQQEVESNNRFYINALDNTIGVQCFGGGKLRLKVQRIWLVAESIENIKTSEEDIHFAIERVS